MAMNTAAFSHHLQTQLSPGVISLLKWTPRGNCKTSFLHFTTLRGTRACSRLAAAGLLESSSSTTAVVLLTPVFYEWHESLGWKLRLHLNFVGGQSKRCLKIESVKLLTALPLFFFCFCCREQRWRIGPGAMFRKLYSNRWKSSLF